MKIFSGILLFVSLVLLLYNDNAFGQTTDNILTVIFIDLGKEGDSTLVIFPNNNTMLIDGGLKFDESFEKVKSVLEENNVRRINLMIGTHADADHIGGLARLLAEDSLYYNKVDEIWTNGLPHTSDIYNEFIENIANQDTAQHRIAVAPMSTNLGNPVLVQLVSPPQEGISSNSDHATEQNSNSLITRMIYGDISFLFTADTTWTTEEWLVENNSELIDIDIMNAPHHGTKYASGYRETGFIEATSPELVIFSANTDNKYGHPHDEAKQRYDDADITLQTGVVGNIVIKTDGKRCSLILVGKPEQPCFDGVQTIPEFPLTVLSLLLAFIPILFLTRNRFANPKLAR